MLFPAIFIYLLWGFTLGAENPSVTITSGKIRGHYKKSYEGRTFSAFEGIPYAKPPVGNLRFEEPQDVEKWNGIWDATIEHECIQLAWQGPMASVVVGNEDCLYINVYVPREQPSPNENLDVVVHIHGGAFMIGSPSIAGPEFLMDRDVVYVNFNYRLGVLGFISTEDDVISGNNGLKDQAFALKWIKNNIAQFGGNPNSVTITGESAGAASVHFQYFSELSRGLFHRGVSYSGTALNPWVIQEAPLEKAKKIAALVGCNQHSTREFVACMKQRSAKHVVENVKALYADYMFPFAPFAPVVEKKHRSAFLKDFPFELLAKGHVYDVPWISSVTTEEGLFPAILLIDQLDSIDKHWKKVMPHILDYNYTVSNSHIEDVSKKIKQFYFGDEKVSINNFRKLIKLCSDRHFHVGFETAARLQAKVAKSAVYTEIYGYGGKKGLVSYFKPDIQEDYGVGHSDDAGLIFTMTLPGLNTAEKLSDSNQQMKEVLINILTSFAKSGKPEVKGVDWKPLTDIKDFQYLFIQKPDEVHMASKESSPEIDFWDSLPIRENGNVVKLKDEL